MKKIAFLYLFLVNYIFATSFVEVYRQKGLQQLQSQLEEVIQNPAYWDEYLKNIDVQKGYYEFDTPIVFVDKQAKIMDLYHNKNHKLTKTSTQNVLVGKKGDKQKEGDLKTPVGVYDIIKRFVPPSSFYGPISFELSYPNLLDNLNNKNGDGIWIHGFPLDNANRQIFTRGCVAVKNDTLVQFDKDLGADNAIVIISENGDIHVKKSQISKILSQFYRWRYAWKISDVNTYLDFYADNFKRYDGKNKHKFSQIKKQIFARKEDKTIQLTHIAISPYPNVEHKNLFRIAFKENYKTKNYHFNGTKELYIQLENGIMKIIAEK